MPLVIVQMWATSGTTDEQKEKLTKGITRAFEEIGYKGDHLHITILTVGKQAVKTIEM